MLKYHLCMARCMLLLLQVLQGHSDDVTCVVLTSRARFVVTGSVDSTAQVWDLAADDVKSVDVHDGKVRALLVPAWLLLLLLLLLGLLTRWHACAA
jgi:WD40 repeat protein